MKKLFALLAVTFVAAVYVFFSLWAPYQGFHDSVIVDLPRGTSTARMGEILEEKGVLSHSWLFLAARAMQRGRRLQAGQYQFTKPDSAMDVFGRIARGDIYYKELLIPEGFNMFDIADAVSKLGFPLSADDFLAAARDPSLIRDLDPQAQSLEGYLFPNKYRVTLGTTAHDLTRAMTSEFRAKWKTVSTGASLSVHDAVTLASLVEREARLPQERPVVSSVFHNRLRIGMKLDCDPTTVYAALLENRYRGTIYRSDLDNPNPYNTYQHAGLPPGPIANPGISSIRAALEPQNTPYLYFVAKADGSGGHNFSDSLAQHYAAVSLYNKRTAGSR